MNNLPKYFDVSIIGGGLAGLSAAIILVKAGYNVIVFEKENYPFHKVCGEYISLESWDLLVSLGLELEKLDLPVITDLLLTSPDGSRLMQKLPLGGFGISRFMIDHALADIAKDLGVAVCDGTRVNEVKFNDDRFTVYSDKINAISKVCCGAFGKRSNLDVKWKRKFVQHRPNSLNNLIGVKYHVSLDHPDNTIALHNFNEGYCGVSPIENNKTCICYLTTAKNLKISGNAIRKMEEEILFKNPFIQETFSQSVFISNEALTISQISFDKKEQVENHVLLIGDAAGMITPLCGNGMSMALHGSRIASAAIRSYLEMAISREEMEIMYRREWKHLFSSRLRAGRIIQSLFGNEWVTNMMVRTLRYFPSMVNAIIRQTHGKK